jgi:CRP/FNR family transcriptional regulator, cyclic AMP receptor protein
MALVDATTVRSATVSAITGVLVAKITKRNFSAIADRHPVLWQRIALELADRLRQRNKFITLRRERPVLFIGSSRESLDVATKIQTALLRNKITVNLWSKSVFTASQVNIEALEAQIPETDFAALVLSSDDKVTSRRTRSDAPRDNVVFELGLFMGGLGRHRTFLVKPRGVDLKVPTDLLGVIPIEYDTGPASTLTKRLHPACAELTKIITTTGTR